MNCPLTCESAQTNADDRLAQMGEAIFSPRNPRMPDDRDALLSLLNSSGFQFQLRVENELARPPWDIFRELHWRHPITQDGGYIDLVAKHGQIRAVIECKRAEAAKWLFLVPAKEPRKKRRAQCLSARRLPGESVFLWRDLRVEPPSYEAPFCIASWKDGKDGMLLEKIAEKLLQAVEALAVEDTRFDQQPRYLLPIVVTAAQLLVATFDSETTCIDTGQLSEAAFRKVPFIRFRKGMAHGFPPPFSPVHPGPAINDLAAYSAASERTIFVIHSSHTREFFDLLEIHPPPSGQRPHALALE
jgi:hypothetical protein